MSSITSVHELLLNHSQEVKDDELANRTYERFSLLPGSNQIATRNALRWILKLSRQYPSLNILEIGAGIGTITSHLFCADLEIEKYFALERNTWCQNRFMENIPQVSNLFLISSVDEIYGQWCPNFIVVDDIMDSSELDWLISRIHDATLIVEGHRLKQRIQILKALKRNEIQFGYRNIGKARDSYKGVGIFQLKSHSRHSKFRFLYTLIKLYLHHSLLRWRGIRAKIPFRRLLGLRVSKA